MTDTFSGKYDLVAAKNRLKKDINTNSKEPQHVNQIGRGYLGTNVFRKDDLDSIFDVITYDYTDLK